MFKVIQPEPGSAPSPNTQEVWNEMSRKASSSIQCYGCLDPLLVSSLSHPQTGSPWEIPIHAVLHTSGQFCGALHSCILSLSTYVGVERPLSQCLCVGSQSTSLLSFILLDDTLSHSLGSPPYRGLLVTCLFWSMFSITCGILVYHPSRDFCRVGFRVQD